MTFNKTKKVSLTRTILKLILLLLLSTNSYYAESIEIREDKPKENNQREPISRQRNGENRILFLNPETQESLQKTADEDCGDCQNPLVQIMPFQFGKDIPDFFSDYLWWEKDNNGLSFDMWRGLEVETNFKPKNPCSDIYYETENPNLSSEDSIIHIGPSGQAKYEVRSWAVIEKASEGEQTLARHVVYKQTPLAKPRISPWGTTQWYDVEEISNQLELVPILGRIQISHDLVALKNGQKYDAGTYIIDWIADPSNENELYTDSYFCEGEFANINGQTYSCNDGIVIGEFSPSTISGTDIFFDKGDIGKTIRKKETPVSFSIQIDNKSKFPPYYIITISNIQNEFGEPLPDNVRIALNVHEGVIQGGDDISGWKVFNTVGGKVLEPILYKPPLCEVAKYDILEFAGICEFNDAPPYIMEKRHKRNIPIECDEYEATLTLKGTLSKTEISSHSQESSSGIDKGNGSSKEMQEASIYIPLKMVHTQDMPVTNQRWEMYTPVDIIVTSLNASYTGKIYHYYSTSNNSSGSETTSTKIKKASNPKITGKELMMQSKTPNIVLIKDRKTDKVIKLGPIKFTVEFQWDETGSKTGSEWNREKGKRPVNNSYNKTSTGRVDVEPVEDEIADPTLKSISESLDAYFKEQGVAFPIKIPDDKKEIPKINPDLLVEFGDGITFFGGDGKKIIDDTEGSSMGRKEMTFEWHVTKKQKK